MKKLLVLAVATICAVFAGPLSAQQQSISIPSRTPTQCSVPGKALGDVSNSCKFLTWPGQTGIIFAYHAPTAPTDSQGNIWTQDLTVEFDGGSIYHTQFTKFSWPAWEYINFAPGEGWNAVIFTYAPPLGTVWAFDQGNQGTYAQQNAPFNDCTNGQDCPYWWTLPVETDAGELLIELGHSNATGLGLATPAMGFNMEWSDGFFFIADIISPVPGVYSGSFIARSQDGTPGGGSHWTSGIVAFKLVKQ